MEYKTYFRKDKDGNEIKVKGFSEYGCGTSTHYKQISKEEYDRLSSLCQGELNAEVEATLSVEQICGYGYYGSKLKALDGMYFLGNTLGNSCD